MSVNALALALIVERKIVGKCNFYSFGDIIHVVRCVAFNKKEATLIYALLLVGCLEVPSRFELLYTVLQTAT